MKKMIYMAIGVLGCCSSCSTDNDMPLSQTKIQVTVSDALQVDSRTSLYESVEDIQEEGQFALNAYIGSSSYIDQAWVYYFNNEWRFRDKVNQGNLFDFHWPNDDSKVDFIAYAPYDLETFAGQITNLSNNDNKVNFTCTLPSTIDVCTQQKLETEKAKREFIYAYSKGLEKSDTPVDLCFVHPLACVKFKLKQGHRNLMIHDITLTGIALSGDYTNDADTKSTYSDGQASLTYEKWTPSTTTDNFTLSIEKDVPNGVNYGGTIGIPFMVIPQSLTDIKLQVKYTWSDYNNQLSGQHQITSGVVSVWQPGKIYTYTLDLGDNKEEILFNVEVEEWVKGEDDGYENSYDVK